MKFQTVEESNAVPLLGEFLRTLPIVDAVRLSQAIHGGQRILMLKSAHAEMMTHLRSDHREMGGLLIGRVWALGGGEQEEYPYLSLIEAAVPARERLNSLTSLSMGSAVWDAAAPYLDQGLQVLGWFHSHPDLGAFFSTTDQNTQRAFLNQAHSIGLVIDWLRGESATFVGPNSHDHNLIGGISKPKVTSALGSTGELWPADRFR